MSEWGGGEEFLRTICSKISDFEFKIITPPGDSLNRFNESNIETIIENDLQKMRQNGEGWNYFDSFKLLIKILKASRRIARIAKRDKCKLILANGNYAGLYALFIKFFTGIDFIVVQHLLYKDSSFESKSIKLQLRFAKLFVCVSNAVKQNLISISGTKKYVHKFEVLHLGMSLPDSHKINTKKISNEKMNIALIGTIINIKGFHLVFEAMKIVKQSKNNFHIHLFGNPIETDESKKYLQHLTDFAHNNLNGFVSFHGFQISKDKIYLDADIVINYSTIPESFSLIVLEAMAYGKIVISADEGGPKEIIDNNVNGFLVPPRSPEKLAEIINMCLEDSSKNKLEEIKIEARNSVAENFTETKLLQNYKSLLHKMVS
ncbi:MAG: glycosyltransferase family 4 protein [Ignavibacteriae bacterium]|nr:glycosyltransferase family 4 protein [Ignavibacteriota bacterium]